MMRKKSRSETSLRQRAIDLLARREYSSQELARRLAAYGQDSDEIATIVTDFAREGLLSDTRFAEQLVRSRAGQYSARFIVQQLREHGVDQATIEHALAENEQDDLDAARALWRKKYGRAPVDMKDKARQVRYLQGRGFDLGVILKVIGSDADEAFDI